MDITRQINSTWVYKRSLATTLINTHAEPNDYADLCLQSQYCQIISMISDGDNILLCE